LHRRGGQGRLPAPPGRTPGAVAARGVAHGRRPAGPAGAVPGRPCRRPRRRPSLGGRARALAQPCRRRRRRRPRVLRPAAGGPRPAPGDPRPLRRDMSRSHLNLVLGLCAIVLVSLVAWRLALRSERPPAPSDRSEYVLRDYELLALDEEGSESFTVTGPHLFREPGARSLLLEQPVFSFPGGEGRWTARSVTAWVRPGGEGRWTARSVTAWVSPGGEELQLRQDVDMIGPPGATGLRTRFRTDFLSVFPERDEAGTTDRVTVTHGESILRGTGLKVDMQAKRFQLLNDVEGRYAPSRR